MTTSEQPPPNVPDGLGERALALWVTLGQKADTPAGVLALEACRAADRLDELDRIIHGKGVLNLMRFRVIDDHDRGDGQHISVDVKFDSVLSEARQQQATLRQMLLSLGLSVDRASSGAPGEPKAPSVADQLAERRKSQSRPRASRSRASKASGA